MANEPTLTIIGNLTADPELRTTQSGTSVANLTIASTPSSYNKQTQQWEDGQALFMRCTAWRQLADHCAQSLTKGMRVIATGRLQQNNYQAKDGTNRSVIEMTLDDIAPSLKYATAQVQKASNNNGYQNAYQQSGNAPAQYQQNDTQWQQHTSKVQEREVKKEMSHLPSINDTWTQDDEFGTASTEPEF